MSSNNEQTANEHAPAAPTGSHPADSPPAPASPSQSLAARIAAAPVPVSAFDTAYERQILREWVAAQADAPVQHSPEWHAIRATTVGGSEIAKVIGRGAYSTGAHKSMLSDKLGLTHFAGNFYTRWGTILEPLTTMWTELFFGMIDPISELGSIVGVLPRQRYSPDGVGVVILADVDGKPMPYIVLFEFKAPANRIPVEYEVPTQYVPQIMTGLLNIPIAECSVFVDACYRVCSMDDLSFQPGYSLGHHTSDSTKKASKRKLWEDVPFACGVVCFSRKRPKPKASKKSKAGKAGRPKAGTKRAGKAGNADDERKEGEERKEGAAVITDLNDLDDAAPLLFDAAKWAANMNNSAQDMWPLLSQPEDLGAGDDNGRVKNMFWAVSKSGGYNGKSKTRCGMVAHYMPIVPNMQKLAAHPLYQKCYAQSANSGGTAANIALADMHSGGAGTRISPRAIIDLQIAAFAEKCKANGEQFVAVLPWKMPTCSFSIDAPDPNWRATIERPVAMFLAKLDRLANAVDENGVKLSSLAAFESEYPAARRKRIAMEAVLPEFDGEDFSL